MSFSECFWSFGSIFTSECWENPSYAVIQVICIIAAIFFTRYVVKKLFQDFAEAGVENERERVEAREKADREHQALVNVDGAESWSCDKIALRLQQLKRYQFRMSPRITEDTGVIAGLIIASSIIQNTQKRDDIEDAILILERRYKDQCSDTASSDTIIGYRNE